MHKVIAPTATVEITLGSKMKALMIASKTMPILVTKIFSPGFFASE